MPPGASPLAATSKGPVWRPGAPTGPPRSGTARILPVRCSPSLPQPGPPSSPASVPAADLRPAGHLADLTREIRLRLAFVRRCPVRSMLVDGADFLVVAKNDIDQFLSPKSRIGAGSAPMMFDMCRFPGVVECWPWRSWGYPDVETWAVAAASIGHDRGLPAHPDTGRGHPGDGCCGVTADRARGSRGRAALLRPRIRKRPLEPGQQLSWPRPDRPASV